MVTAVAVVTDLAHVVAVALAETDVVININDS